MKHTRLLGLAFKYLWRYRRRYLFLFLALTFGFTIVTLITSVKDDMYENVYRSAQEHYAGDIIAIGYDKSAFSLYHLTYGEAETISRAAGEAQLNPARTVRRTSFGERGVVYFNGAAARLKYVIGVDWDNEASYFNSLNYQSPLDVAAAGGDTIVLSAPVAGKLGARAGDSVILELDTRWGQKNTGVFTVGGIVNDSSIFGYYKVYVSRLTLNRLLLYDDGDCSMAGFYFADRMGIERKRARLHEALSRHIPAGPLVKDRDELTAETNGSWEGTKTFVISLPVYLSEVSDLLGALNIITYFLYGMMLIIILASATVTYRLLLRERSRELGTMRAIGFHGADVRLVLVAEAGGLALAAILSGFLCAFTVSRTAGFVSFAWFPGFEIFLKEGRLRSLYLAKTLAVNIMAVLGIMFAAVWGPAWRLSRGPLPRLLSGGDA